MSHRIRFRVGFLADLRVPGKPRLERLRVREGDVVTAEVTPHVAEGEDGPVEMADLYLGDGTVALDVRFGYFEFV
jgi:hypothetical protein